eukprot:scaffold46163_cov46-Prasinocladus_malaysianus.AAC.2
MGTVSEGPSGPEHSNLASISPSPWAPATQTCHAAARGYPTLKLQACGRRSGQDRMAAERTHPSGFKQAVKSCAQIPSRLDLEAKLGGMASDQLCRLPPGSAKGAIFAFWTGPPSRKELSAVGVYGPSEFFGDVYIGSLLASIHVKLNFATVLAIGWVRPEIANLKAHLLVQPILLCTKPSAQPMPRYYGFLCSMAWLWQCGRVYVCTYIFIYTPSSWYGRCSYGYADRRARLTTCVRDGWTVIP